MTKYRARPMKCAKRKYCDRSKEELYYIEEEELQRLYPNGGFKLLADIHKNGNRDAEHILEGRHADIHLFPYQKKIPWLKGLIGYVPVSDEKGEEGYLRIIKTAWHRPLLIMLTLMISAMIFLIGVQFAQSQDESGLDKTAVSYHIDGVKNTDKDSILLPGLSVLHGNAKDTHMKAALINPDGNECYFQYTIRLKSTGETLYTSGLIKPGTAVMEFDLSRVLPEGKYPIQVLVETRDLSDRDIVYNPGNIDAQLVITK